MPDTHGHAHGHAHGNGHGNAHGHAHGNAHGHDHGGHDHGEPLPVGTRPLLRAALRFVVATVIVLAAVMTACSVMVPAGEAIVISQLGDPVRVLTSPGLAWKFPAPIQTAIPIDLRLRTTSTGLQDVGTRDGLRILVQVYVAWQVPAEPAPVRKFLRAARNDQDEAARQLRSYVGSALQVAASRFDLSDLVNTDPAKVQLPAFEERVRSQIGPDVLATYGIAIREVGIERLSLPDITLAATVERMRAERETVAAQRTAEGLRAAAEIRSDAARDSRITVARAKTEAAAIEAEARRAAAEIYGKAYTSDPSLYLMLRSLDTLGQVVSANTRLVLRTDAPPFDLLTQPLPGGPPSDGH